MRDIEEILEMASLQEIEIPLSVENKIHSVLKEKKKKNIIIVIIQKIITFIATVIGLLAGGVAVYAGASGLIEGVPTIDWLDIKFSNKYVDYKKEVTDQIITYNETTVELTSTICNEGLTILEFDVKLGNDDYNKLKLGEKVYYNEYYKWVQENKREQEEYYKKLAKWELFQTKYFNSANLQQSNENYQEAFDNFVMTDDDFKDTENYKEYIEWCKESDENLEEQKKTGYIVGLALNTNQKGGTYNYDKWNPNTDWYASLYINDEPYYVKNFEKIEKITDYEYKIYVMYIITDNEVNTEEEFKITLKNNKIVNLPNYKNQMENWTNDCSWWADESRKQNFTDLDVIDLDGEYTVNVSKQDILKDSKVIENIEAKSEFRNISFNVDKVVVSPIQTIVKITKTETDQSSFKYRTNNSEIEQLTLTRNFKIYDSNENELKCFFINNFNTLIYSDGTRELYPTQELPNKNYKNAIWETVFYLLIENTDSEYIKIVPTEILKNSLDGTKINIGEIDYDMEPIIINLK